MRSTTSTLACGLTFESPSFPCPQRRPLSSRSSAAAGDAYDVVAGTGEIPAAEPAASLTVGLRRELPAPSSTGGDAAASAAGTSDLLVPFNGELGIVRSVTEAAPIPATELAQLDGELREALGPDPTYEDLYTIAATGQVLADSVPADLLLNAPLPAVTRFELIVQSAAGPWEPAGDLIPPDEIMFASPVSAHGDQLVVVGQSVDALGGVAPLVGVSDGGAGWEQIVPPPVDPDAGRFTSVVVDSDGDRTLAVYSTQPAPGFAEFEILPDDTASPPTLVEGASVKAPAGPSAATVEHRVVIVERVADRRVDTVLDVDVVWLSSALVLDDGYVLSAFSAALDNAPVLLTSADGTVWSESDPPIAGSTTDSARLIGTIDGDEVVVVGSAGGRLVSSIGSPFSGRWSSVALPVFDGYEAFPDQLVANEHGVVVSLDLAPRTTVVDCERGFEFEIDGSFSVVEARRMSSGAPAVFTSHLDERTRSMTVFDVRGSTIGVISPQALTSAKAPAAALAWSPDGRRWSTVRLDMSPDAAVNPAGGLVLLDDRIALQVVDLSPDRPADRPSLSVLTIDIGDD